MKNNPLSHFMLFPTCIPVKGKSTGIIMDLDRTSCIEIPNLLCDILSIDLKHYTIEEVKQKFNNKYDNGIDEYFQFLVDKELGFYTQNPTPFNKISNVFESPYKVISSVIALNNKSSYDLKNVLNQLVELGCQLLQIRVYNETDLKTIFEALDLTKGSRIRIIELYLPYSQKYEDEELIKLVKSYHNLLLAIHSAPENKQLDVSKESVKKVAFVKNQLTPNSKEVYTKQLLTISHKMYREANHFNSGLYRKVCIDEHGEIKNYLSHPLSFGNVSQGKLTLLSLRF